MGVGFRGFKHDKPTQMHLTCAKGAPNINRKVARVDDVYCDMCGIDVMVDKDEDKDIFIDPLEMLMSQNIKEQQAAKTMGQDPTMKKGADGEDHGPLEGAVKESAGAF